MLEEQELKDLVSKSRGIKSEISEIRAKLDKINEVKEEWYSKKEEFSKEIVKLISEIKKFRKIRDELTRNVSDSKKKRTDMNAKINAKISEIKELQSKLAKESGASAPVNVRELKKEMDSITFKLETEPMSFNAEQKLMKRVKEIKKIIGSASDNSGVSSSVRELSKEIDDLKKEADEIHLQVQKNASESQKKHEEMISFSKQIDDLKVKEDEAYKMFTKHKNEFIELNNVLKDKFKELAPLTKKLDTHKIENTEKKQKTKDVVIKEKQVSVEEKIQKGHKLTTDDLLVFQKMNEE